MFKRHGRSKAWKRLKRITKNMIKLRRERYFEEHKIIISSPGASSTFFKNVRAYKTVEKPKIWDIRSVRPLLSDQELSRELSLYFNTISNEFQPLYPHQIPKTYSRTIPELSPYQVSGRNQRRV